MLQRRETERPAFVHECVLSPCCWEFVPGSGEKGSNRSNIVFLSTSTKRGSKGGMRCVRISLFTS